MRIDPQKKISPTANGFIVIEGPNGAGKSTLQQSLAQLLEQKGRKVVVTREPGATPLGKELRSILLEGRTGAISHRAEMLLFAADRAEHVEKVIRPALAQGQVVISDRYFYSTTAFQGYGRGLALETILTLNDVAIAGTVPDLVLLLDIDPAAGLSRIKGRGGDSFEDEELAFHQRIRSAFLQLADSRPEPFLVLDATEPREVVFAKAAAVVGALLGVA